MSKSQEAYTQANTHVYEWPLMLLELQNEGESGIGPNFLHYIAFQDCVNRQDRVKHLILIHRLKQSRLKVN